MFCSCRLLCRMSSKDRHIESSCPSYIKTEPSSPASLTDSVNHHSPGGSSDASGSYSSTMNGHQNGLDSPTLYGPTGALGHQRSRSQALRGLLPAPSRRTRQLNCEYCWTPCPSAYVWFAGTSPPATITGSPPARPARPFSRGPFKVGFYPSQLELQLGSGAVPRGQRVQYLESAQSNSIHSVSAGTYCT